MDISVTEKSIFKTCRRRWDYQSANRQNLQPRSPSQPLWFGRCIHFALETYYGQPVSQRAGVACQTFLRYTTDTLKRIEESVAGNEAVLSPLVELKELGMGMMHHYESWAPQQDEWFEVLVTEQEFRIPIMHPDDHGIIAGYLPGTFDALIKATSGIRKGKYYLVDHKTYSIEMPDDFFFIDDQFITYVYAVNFLIANGALEHFGIPRHVRLSGLLYNGLRKKVPRYPQLLKSGGLSKAKNQDTTYEVYRAALKDEGLCENDYADILDFLKGKGNRFFKRHIVVVTETDQQLAMERLWHEHREMSQHPTIYHTPSYDCAWRCPFVPLCIAENAGADRDYLLETQYEQADPRGTAYPHPTRNSEDILTIEQSTGRGSSETESS